MTGSNAPVHTSFPPTSRAPAASMPGLRTLEDAVQVLRHRRVAVLTGAGCSTRSGIPDYGGLTSRTRGTRIQYRAFVDDPLARRRYWARSLVGWPRVATASPNSAHVAIAALETAGVATGVITQNVDGLHQLAGSQRVVELHGSLARVRCLACDAIVARAELQADLLRRNPRVAPRGGAPAPDGDAELDDAGLFSFEIPSCQVCGGTFKPDVVFFGENVPKPRLQRAWEVYEDSDVLLVAGSSLAVFSGYRFVLRAVKDGMPVIIVNAGDTRGDGDAWVKIDDQLETTLPALVEALV